VITLQAFEECFALLKNLNIQRTLQAV